MDEDNLNDLGQQDGFDMAAWAPAAIGWGHWCSVPAP